MKDRKARKQKTAESILLRCIGNKGVWADPTRYARQCWTRDLVLASMTSLLQMGKDEIVAKHLKYLSEKQRKNGQIPILFLDQKARWVLGKVARSVRSLRLSFMLKRFLQGQLWNLTPGTRDSEILYIIGMYEYTIRTSDRKLLRQYEGCIEKALEYIESELQQEGLVHGADWRDTMHVELMHKPLLTNNALMYRVYRLLEDETKAQELKSRINCAFWDAENYLDYPGQSRFDPLGAAFAVIYDVVPTERYPDVAKGFRSVDSEHGVTIKCRHNPYVKEERKVIERTDGVVVWPFIVGYTVLALLKMDQKEMAGDQFQKLLALEGFKEWYDPATGKGYGASEQLWSAALFGRAAAALG